MHIYKFRMLSDINDDFVRDVEILANQTFEDFHKVINECVKLNGKELASFYICDQKWSKKREITLIDMLNQNEVEDAGNNEQMDDSFIMKDSLIKDFIEEPHQRLLYEYDFLNTSTLFIELLSVFKQKQEGNYPRCSFSRGELVSPVGTEIMEEDEELTEQLLNDFNELLDDTFDYKGDDDDNPL